MRYAAASAEVTWTAPGEGMFESLFNKDAVAMGGAKVNALLVARQSATSPGFPLVIEISATQSEPVQIVGAMRLVARDQWANIPVFVVPGA